MRPQLFPVHGVAVAAQGVDEGFEGVAFPLRAGLPATLAITHHRSPAYKLLDVLQHDHPGPNRTHPAHHDPGEAAHAGAHRLPATGLAVVGAVGAEPSQPHRLALTDLARIHVPHRLAVVPGVRVVGFVHRQGGGVVVDGDVHRATDGTLDAGGGATTASEVVHHQLAEVQARLQVAAEGAHSMVL